MDLGKALKCMSKYTQALVFYQPRRIALKGGYFGSLYTIDVFRKNKGSPIEIIDLDAAYQPGDLCWLETPVNPTGDSRYVAFALDRVSLSAYNHLDRFNITLTRLEVFIRNEFVMNIDTSRFTK
jgi:hypothetical protein